MSAKGPALNLLIYPSPLAQPGRITKIARSLHTQGRFERTEILGVDSTQLPARESLAPGLNSGESGGPQSASASAHSAFSSSGRCASTGITDART